MVAWVQRQWRSTTPWHALLIPLSWLFAILSALRRTGYTSGLLRRQHLAVPVIIIGNISVGGTGKTPLVIWLAQQLAAHGRHPGIISRGYGGNAATPQAVSAHSNAAIVGDEPRLLAQRLACPVWIGRNRPAAGRALLAAHPEVDVILSDDGLQHYALARDVEIAVIDSSRGFGNARLLPAGPLREPLNRLQQVDAVIVNQTGASHPGLPPLQHAYAMQLVGHHFTNLKHPKQTAVAADFSDSQVHAVAGIGHPQRFFDQLDAMGLHVIPHAFADHYQYQASDLNFPGIIIMTEKDAVKCQAFVTEHMWVWPVQAQLDPELLPRLLAKLGNHHG
ncbi:tetraacyldisaccharide 4'-kinase [Sulfuriferula sp. AH1]|uniref:tetraacyldisaccharide 4'-kinase n=1 Tax=Sulfuriferula sp. AH1 TaxID=1985873 RepID=UPI000B3B1000|nr:tetraacyldisaccharide 4'-kinase [Sulfuriferula sp. AH1]ARU32072.1 tetraacyldisaccharide 4'-kinase [Sulfuriferula sp. AH1]